MEMFVREGNAPISCRKPTTNPQLTLLSKLFWKVSSRQMDALNACFRCTGPCDPHCNMLPITVGGVRAQDPGFSCKQLKASLFDAAGVPLSKPLAAPGQPHLIDVEAPWPAPFGCALSLQVFLGHYFLTLDLWVRAVVMDSSFVTKSR